ncbi:MULTISPECIES: DNA polymerase III subunit beta [Bombella]|uniref:Beta sliding clamp n=1 Tax=Bombella pollinis TaxID=2967337 RepID=A0ABT3WQU9_9PROT|nr:MULTISPECIES: DNA polymerase III subunit beta [Bombella]MCX5619211.1 DNA polymerase III subunit beta [Bombella pollinis]MUG90227.1 DNA polymerase III subunit beta [Bombella sp. ESL0385]
MKFKVDRAPLLRALSHVNGVAEKRNTIPILANVLLEHDGETLRLTATDMEIAVVEEIPSTATRAGAVTIPAAVLFEIVRKLPDGAEIEFNQESAEEPLHLRAGRYATSLNVLPVDDFPAMVAGDLPHHFTIQAGELRTLIDRTRFAMSNEETRYYLNGIYLHVVLEGKKNYLRAVATDGHRLAKVDTEAPLGVKSMPGIIVPRKTVTEVRKLLDNDGADVEVALSETRIQFRIGSILLTSKLVDGTFPEYSRVIPQNNSRILRVSKQDLAAAVGRVAAISQERSRPIKLTVTKNHLTLSAISPDQGIAQEELDENSVSYDSDDVEIGFQARYLTDITDQIDAEAEFALADSSSPTLIRDTEQPAVLYVLMPIRV